MVEHHLSSHRWTTTVATLAALTLSAGCGSSSDADPETAASASSSSSPEPSTEPSPEPSTENAEATPIDGTWSTPTLAAADFRRVLTAHGLGTHADAFVAGFGDTVDLTLEVGGGFWTLSSSIDGGATTVTDRGSFEIDGKQVIVLPNSGGENTFRWRVAGDELTLDLISTTEPPYEGVPAETYQRGLYTASPFVRTT